MCQDCVAKVKDLMVKLCLEKNGLVERLNAIHDQIEEETDLLSKVRLKVAWKAEKQRCVGPLQKVSPFSNSLPPSFNREHPDAHQFPRRLPSLFKGCWRRAPRVKRGRHGEARRAKWSNVAGSWLHRVRR